MYGHMHGHCIHVHFESQVSYLMISPLLAVRSAPPWQQVNDIQQELQHNLCNTQEATGSTAADVVRPSAEHASWVEGAYENGDALITARGAHVIAEQLARLHVSVVWHHKFGSASRCKRNCCKKSSNTRHKYCSLMNNF
jgi:hypothetical protein